MSLKMRLLFFNQNLFVIKRYLESFINLIYPNLCVACGEVLSGNEENFCSYCLADMPVTNFWNQPENPVEQLFWGKIQVEHAASFIYFEKDSKYQNALHKLKYNNRKEVGTQLGRVYGYHLKNSRFNTIDAILPVPLHKKRFRKRGYNQSEMICQGLSLALSKPVLTEPVIRNVHTKSQTKKNRYNRWLNVEGIFKCVQPEAIEGKHILIVDDVVTTGATIESLASEILKIPGTKVSVATIAVA